MVDSLYSQIVETLIFVNEAILFSLFEIGYAGRNIDCPDLRHIPEVLMDFHRKDMRQHLMPYLILALLRGTNR